MTDTEAVDYRPEPGLSARLLRVGDAARSETGPDRDQSLGRSGDECRIHRRMSRAGLDAYALRVEDNARSGEGGLSFY